MRISPGAAFLYAVTGLVAVFSAAPLLIPIAISFSDTNFTAFPPRGFTLRWYAAVLQDPEFLRALWVSTRLALAATLVSLLLGTPAAFALVRGEFRGKAALQGLLLSPLIVPVLVSGIALLQLFTAMGPANVWLRLVIAHVLVTVPYVVRTVSVSLQLVDIRLEEAARTLGASRFQALRRIILPQIAPGLAAGALFAFMISFDNYPISMWLNDAEHLPLPILIYDYVRRLFDPSISAISAMMTALAVVVVLALERLMGLRRTMGM